jgi:NhaP-type Na+/H+ or K+/H+ antiporter
MFGTVAIAFLDAADLGIVIYAVLSLTLVRMVPVAVAVRGMGFRPSTVAFMGWFGPRGLASIILAVVVVDEEPELPALGVILAAMTVTVLASVVLHGVTALPGVRAYEQATRGDP